ncbi:cannabinoid receptor 1-like [Nematostella vectensis]|uniref:cannabinoid receptor 1-like n=1 Tax=Nematostella vectensis TaxID=45351 RepID=UPI0020770DFB|nr:cannabinoid receptor 1-like [Nematostella vectensis]
MSGLPIVSSTVIYLSGIMAIVLSVSTTIINTSLLFVIVKDPLKCLRKPSTGFITSLALTNLAFGLVTDTTYAMALFEGLGSGYVNMDLKTIQTASGFFTFTSVVVVIVALTVECLLGTLFPIFHRNCITFKSSILVSCGVWAYALLFTMMQFADINFEVYELLDTHLHHTVPFGAILLCYLFIYRGLRKRTRACAPKNASNQQTEAGELKFHKQLLLTVILVGLLLFLTLVPFQVTLTMMKRCLTCDINKLYASFLVSLNFMYTNPALNTLLYAWRTRPFRRSFRAMFCRGRDLDLRHSKLMASQRSTSGGGFSKPGKTGNEH